MTALVQEKGCADMHSLYYAMTEHACQLEDELSEIKKVLTEVVVELIDAAVL